LLQLPESENSVQGDDVYEESDDELNGIDSTSTTQRDKSARTSTSHRTTRTERDTESYHTSGKKRKQVVGTGGAKKIKR